MRAVEFWQALPLNTITPTSLVQLPCLFIRLPVETAFRASSCYRNFLGALSCNTLFSAVAGCPPYILKLATGNQRQVLEGVPPSVPSSAE